MVPGGEVLIQGGLLDERPDVLEGSPRSVLGAPKMVMLPSLGWERPVMDFMMVVLPEPLGPSRTTTWPRATEKLMFLAPRPL